MRRGRPFFSYVTDVVRFLGGAALWYEPQVELQRIYFWFNGPDARCFRNLGPESSSIRSRIASSRSDNSLLSVFVGARIRSHGVILPCRPSSKRAASAARTISTWPDAEHQGRQLSRPPGDQRPVRLYDKRPADRISARRAPLVGGSTVARYAQLPVRYRLARAHSRPCPELTTRASAGDLFRVAKARASRPNARPIRVVMGCGNRSGLFEPQSRAS